MKTFVSRPLCLQPGCGVPEVGPIKGPPSASSVGGHVPGTVSRSPKATEEVTCPCLLGPGGQSPLLGLRALTLTYCRAKTQT